MSSLINIKKDVENYTALLSSKEKLEPIIRDAVEKLTKELKLSDLHPHYFAEDAHTIYIEHENIRQSTRDSDTDSDTEGETDTEGNPHCNVKIGCRKCCKEFTFTYIRDLNIAYEKAEKWYNEILNFETEEFVYEALDCPRLNEKGWMRPSCFYNYYSLSDQVKDDWKQRIKTVLSEQSVIDTELARSVN